MLGLYIHIPFCKKKCNYCDFLSFTSKEYEAYIDSLCLEIDYIIEDNPSYSDIDTIFIGGGTPSIIPGTIIEKLFKKIQASFNLSNIKEFSIEANPGTLDEGKIEVYRKYGLNRISIGLQSANDEELRLLGRIHNYKDFLKTYENVKKAGFKNINIDLMSAIPNQTIESYEKTLREICSLQASHISSYSLIIEEGTNFYKRYKDKPPIDEDTDRKMYDLTKQILEEHGYNRYEISNYAKKGFECIHNKKYWQRKDYLGIGLGAASCINNKRFSNIRDLSKYIKNSKERLSFVDEESIEILTKEDQMAEFVYLGLRLMEGIKKSEFLKIFSCDIMDIYGEKIKKHISNGLLEEREDNILLTSKGIDISNIVFMDFV